MLLCFECGFEDFGRGQTAGMEGEHGAMAEVREPIGVREWGSQGHLGWDRCATAGSWDGNGERTVGHEVSSAGMRWRASS